MASKKPVEMKDDEFTKGVQGGFKNAINGDWESIKNALKNAGNSVHESYIKNQGDNGTLQGFRNMVTRSDKPHTNEEKSMKEEAGHYAQGGEVEENPFLKAGRLGLQGLAQVPGAFMNALQQPAESARRVISAQPMEPFSTIAGMTPSLAPAAPQPPAPPAPDVDADFMAKLNAGTALSPTVTKMDSPAAPPLKDMASSLSKTPDTNYDFYKNIGADQRAELYKQLLEKQRSGGNLLAQAIGGIGDSITNSFGKGGANFQNEARDIAAKNTENRIGAVDTQRQQRLQDLNANIEAQMSDPKSRVSQSMQRTLRSAGLNVPAGMPGKVMLQVAGPLGELAMKQATIEENKAYHQADIGVKKQEIGRKEEEFNIEHPFLTRFDKMTNKEGAAEAPRMEVGMTMKHPSGATIRKVR